MGTGHTAGDYLKCKNTICSGKIIFPECFGKSPKNPVNIHSIISFPTAIDKCDLPYREDNNTALFYIISAENRNSFRGISPDSPSGKTKQYISFFILFRSYF